MKDDLGDRMKAYEKQETGRKFKRGLPVYARIDGRAFRNFTRGMTRPYDERLSEVMLNTTKKLVTATNALVGYTQSDEISLLWHEPQEFKDVFFSGKVQKMTSVLAALTTACFYESFIETSSLPLQTPLGSPQPNPFMSFLNLRPHFDCRAFSLPDVDEAVNVFIWREKDASRNAIQMVAQDKFSHTALQGVSTLQCLTMLEDAGVSMEAFSRHFRFGCYVKRTGVERTLTLEEMATIPVDRRPVGPVKRFGLESRSFFQPLFLERKAYFFDALKTAGFIHGDPLEWDPL